MNRMSLPAVLAVALVASLLAACGSGGGDDSGGQAGGAGETVDIVETDFELEPATVMIEEPGTYTFHVVNEGGTVHALEIEGQGLEEETEEIDPGSSADLTVEITEPGEYELYCPVDGHREQGMEGTLSLGGGTGGDEDTTTEDDTTTEEDGGYGYR